MCIAPLTIYHKNRQVTDKYSHTVPCGKCPPCLKRRSSQWAFRLREEQKNSKTAVFLTLTYDEENVPYTQNGFQTLDKTHHQLFMKKLRKYIRTYETKHRKIARLEGLPLPEYTKLKYYHIGEYGDTFNRPHYHTIMYNLPRDIINNPDVVCNLWGLGNTRTDDCGNAQIRYVTNYVTKGKFKRQHCQDTGLVDDRQELYSTQSNGLGESYITYETVKFHLERELPVLVEKDGILQSMPRYYKTKIFNRTELNRISEQYEKIRNLKIQIQPFEEKEHARLTKERYYDTIRKDEKKRKLKQQNC